MCFFSTFALIYCYYLTMVRVHTHTRHGPLDFEEFSFHFHFNFFFFICFFFLRSTIFHGKKVVVVAEISSFFCISELFSLKKTIQMMTLLVVIFKIGSIFSGCFFLLEKNRPWWLIICDCSDYGGTTHTHTYTHHT